MKNNSKILNIDSRDISKKIEKNSVDFIIFSPPYWNLRNYGFDEQIGFKENYEEYLSSMKAVFQNLYKVLSNKRFMAINIGTVVSKEGMKFTSGDFIRLSEEVGFKFRKDIIWHKPKGTTKWQRGATQFTQNPYPFMYNTNINHEYILIFSKGNIEANKNKKSEKPFGRTFTRKMAYSVWDIPPVNSPKLDEKHVAPFPIEIPIRLISLYSRKGDITLDPFAGSGTSNQAALLLGRKTIAVEKSKEYCNLIKKKIKSTKFNSYDQTEFFDDSIEFQLSQIDQEIVKFEKKIKNSLLKKKKILKKNHTKEKGTEDLTSLIQKEIDL